MRSAENCPSSAKRGYGLDQHLKDKIKSKKITIKPPLFMHENKTIKLKHLT
jgi:hypothetical protein